MTDNSIQGLPNKISAKKVMDEEKKALNLDGNPIGLALSGGGIRSASFSIGVMQAMDETEWPAASTNIKNPNDEKKGQKPTFFELLNYLSSVSGGGYAANAYNWLRGRSGTSFFPFNRDDQRKASPPESGEIKGEKILDFLRFHGYFLTPSKSINLFAAIGTVLRGGLVSASFYFSTLVLTMATLIFFSTWFMDQKFGADTDLGTEIYTVVDVIDNKLTKGVKSWENWLKNKEHKGNYGKSVVYCKAFPGKTCSYREATKVILFGGSLIVLFIGAFLALIIVSIIVRLIVFFKGRLYSSNEASGGSKYNFEIFLTKWLGKFLFYSLMSLLLVIIPIVYLMTKSALVLIGPIGIMTGLITAGLKFRNNAAKPPLLANWPKTGSAGVIIGAGIFILVLMVLGFWVALEYICKNDGLSWVLIPLGFFFILGFLSINLSALGRYYRDRIMETFMPEDKAINAGQWQKNTAGDKWELSNLNKDDSAEEIRQPYNLINANLVLTAADNAKYKSRKGDSFLFSQLYVGSDATKYVVTEGFMKSGKRGMTTATAMAISGAALNPGTGSGGKGPTTNRLVSMLMVYFNFRLGYWAPNPDLEHGYYPSWKGRQQRANYFSPGIATFFGKGQSEEDRFIELSDGGHYENLGLYELLRRQCKLIISSDAGADPEFKFEDLATAVERIRADFGYDIRFNDEDYDISYLIPGSATTKPKVLGERFNTAKRGYALATIDYGNDKEPGLLLYVKTTVCQGLPADVYGYKAMHPEFPDQSTADQFFDESQFEAYRELGYQIMLSALEDPNVRIKVGKAI